MAAPAIIALISSLLGRKKDKPGSYQMQGVDANKQPTVGNATGQPPPQQAPQQGGGFQNVAGKAQTIGSILGSLKGGQQQPQGYQMQLRRRR